MANRRGEARAWLPALVAPVVFLALLFGMWALNKASLGGDSGPASSDAPLWRWLLEANNAFWGASPFSTADGAKGLAATLASAGVILVLGYLGSWRAVAGLRAGSSAWPGFLALWMVTIAVSVIGAATHWLVLNSGRLGVDGAGQTEFAVLTNGLQYGAKYGWLSALLAVLLWMLVRPAPQPARVLPGQLGPPAPYPREREDFFRQQARTGGYDRDRDGDGLDETSVIETTEADSPEDDRLAALRAQVEAEAAEEEGGVRARWEGDGDPYLDPYEPRPNPTPPSLLDQHRQEPAPTFSRDADYDTAVSGRWGPAPDADPEVFAEPRPEASSETQPEPEPQPVGSVADWERDWEPESDESTYVGRRASTEYDPRTDIPSAEAPYGSHRGKRARRDED